ncbi:MAG: TRAP transporter small permease [Pseudomonadota bacterium]
MTLERLGLVICAASLFVMMAVGALDILLDELFSYPLAFKVDLSSVLLAASVFLAWPLAQRQGEHIKVELVYKRLPRPLQRFGDLLSLLCALLVFGLITYGAWQMAIDSVSIMEVSPATLGFPIWPAKLACAIGVSLTLLVVIRQLLTPLFSRGVKR